MKDLGEANLILDMKIIRSSDFISLSLSHYTQLLIDKFGFFDYSPVSILHDPSIQLVKKSDKLVNQERYVQIIGSLMYLSNRTRSNIAHTISRLSHYTSNPNKIHWIALEGVFRYLKSTTSYWLKFVGYLAIL